MDMAGFIDRIIRLLAGLAAAPALQPIPAKAKSPKIDRAAPRGKMERMK